MSVPKKKSVVNKHPDLTQKSILCDIHNVCW